MQKQNLLKERNGASLKPETQAPSSTVDTAVVVMDKMTRGEWIEIGALKTRSRGGDRGLTRIGADQKSRVCNGLGHKSHPGGMIRAEELLSDFRLIQLAPGCGIR